LGLCYEETGYEIWKTDGTSEGTKVLKDITPGSSPGLDSELFPEKQITKYNGKLYFVGTEGNEENEEVLWVSEGETSTTIKFGEGNIEANNTNGMHVYEGLLYFYGKNKITNEEGILRTDGTLEGTDLVVDNEEIEIRALGDFRLINDKIFFFEKEEEFTAWFTVFDMATEEMIRIDDFIEGVLKTPLWLFSFQGKMLFTTNTDEGKILCETDGTELGTRILFEGQYEGSFNRIRYKDNSSIIFHTNDIEEDFLSRLYFAADTDTAIPIYSPELGNNSEGVRSWNLSMKQIGEYLFFEKEDELWRTDGTFGGTEKIFDDADIPHKYNENFYYSNNQIADTANQLWSFNEAFESQQVGNENENIIRPYHFNSKISGKLIFLSEHPTDENLYRIHALDLPPNSIFDEKSERTELTLFPNPAQNELTIPLSVDFQDKEIELSIQDVSGQVLLNQTMIGEESLNLDFPSDLANGMYFLKITTENKEAFGKVMILK
jgi:ELWxxDGT repeat protein